MQDLRGAIMKLLLVIDVTALATARNWKGLMEQSDIYEGPFKSP